MVIYDDAKRVTALAKAQLPIDKIDNLVNWIRRQVDDITDDECLELLGRLQTQKNWAKDTYNAIERIYKPTADAPPEL